MTSYSNARDTCFFPPHGLRKWKDSRNISEEVAVAIFEHCDGDHILAKVKGDKRYWDDVADIKKILNQWYRNGEIEAGTYYWGLAIKITVG